MTARTYVAIKGCDDVTKIILELGTDEVAAVEKLRDAVNAASESACQPTIEIRPAMEWDEDEGAVAS